MEFVSNPAVVSLDGIQVLIYHGESFNELPMAIKGLSYEKNEYMMEELLRKRHLAPIYGERTPLASLSMFQSYSIQDTFTLIPIKNIMEFI